MRLEQAAAGSWPSHTGVLLDSDRLLRAMVSLDLGTLPTFFWPDVALPVCLSGIACPVCMLALTRAPACLAGRRLQGFL